MSATFFCLPAPSASLTVKDRPAVGDRINGARQNKMSASDAWIGILFPAESLADVNAVTNDARELFPRIAVFLFLPAPFLLFHLLLSLYYDFLYSYFNVR